MVSGCCADKVPRSRFVLGGCSMAWNSMSLSPPFWTWICLLHVRYTFFSLRDERSQCQEYALWCRKPFSKHCFLHLWYRTPPWLLPRLAWALTFGEGIHWSFPPWFHFGMPSQTFHYFKGQPWWWTHWSRRDSPSSILTTLTNVEQARAGHLPVVFDREHVYQLYH